MKPGKNGYYEVPRLFGLHRVPHEPAMKQPMVWGQRWMIQFLIALEREWIDRWMFAQREYDNDFAKIPLGDISRNGGGPPRAPEGHANHRFAGHLSHRDGVDVDLFYIGTDNVPSAKRHPRLPGFDAERTKSLGFSILKAGGKLIERIFLAEADPDLLQAMKQKALTINPKIHWHADGIHNNHFHVRLVAKDPTR